MKARYGEIWAAFCILLLIIQKIATVLMQSYRAGELAKEAFVMTHFTFGENFRVYNTFCVSQLALCGMLCVMCTRVCTSVKSKGVMGIQLQGK